MGKTISKSRRDELSRLFSANPHLESILVEMFKRVGGNFKNCTFKDKWYWEHEWTAEEELNFKKWMDGYLTAGAIRELTGRCIVTTPSYRQKLIEEFLFQWGWKRKETA
jgi:hypothetical protein